MTSGPTTKELGDRVKRARSQAGLTQAQLAHKVGVSVVTISRIERGETTDPESSTLRGIAEATGISSSWLIGDAVEADAGRDREISVGEAALVLISEKRNLDPKEKDHLRKHALGRAQFYSGASDYSAILSDLEVALEEYRISQRGFAKSKIEGEAVDTSAEYDGPKRRRRRS